MFVQTRKVLGTLFILSAVFWTGGWQAALANESWRVVKSSGEVWMLRGEAQLVAIRTEAALNPGDNIRTGRSGRVLLARGEERILISPNSEIGLPIDNEGQSGTTIRQQAGSILLEVQKKNVPHFEVETPYLAAVVKGTQFRVSVNSADARVDVLRGQVQVSDHKSGQQIVLLPGQAAMAAANGAGGLSLSGKGQFNPVEQGKPRATGLRALSIPKGGLQPPRLQSNQPRQGQIGGTAGSSTAESVGGKTNTVQRLPGGAVRIGTALGEVKLDYQKVTKGLARSAGELVVTSAKRRSAGGDAYASATDNASRATNGDSSSSKSAALSVGNASVSSSNGLALGVGSGNGGGGGVAVSVGGGSGSGGGLSLGVGNGSGGGLSASVGGGGLTASVGGGLTASVGGGGLTATIGGTGLSLGGGGGTGLLGLTTGLLGLGKKR
jgi:hypothetical protein